MVRIGEMVSVAQFDSRYVSDDVNKSCERILLCLFTK